MAGDSIIGALRVVLGADSAALEKGLKGAQSSVSDFGAAVVKAGAVAAAAFVAVGAGVAVAVRGAIKDADDFGKMAQRIGMSVEELSGLKHAADLSDVSMESLSKSVGKLSKAMVEAAAKPTSEAATAFRALGVSVVGSDGALKSSATVLSDVAEQFAGLKDGAGKTAAAMAIFGKSGADLIPMLNAGRDGLNEMTAEAAQLGLVIDTKTAKSAEAFRDNLTRLSKVKDGIIIQLTAKMLPAMEMLSQRLIDGVKNSGLMESITNGLSKAFEYFARGILVVVDNFKPLLAIAAAFAAVNVVSAAVTAIVAFVRLARAIQAAGLMMAAFEAIRGITLKGILLLAGALAVATGYWDQMIEKIGQIGSKISGALPSEMGDTFRSIVKALGFDLSALDKQLSDFGGGGADKATKSLKDFNYAAMGGKNAIDQFISSQQKSLESQNAEIQTYGMLAGAKQAMTLQLQAEAVARANNTTISQAQQVELDKLKQKTLDYNLTLQGLQLTESNLTPSQTYQLELQKIQGLFDAGKISAETYGRAMQSAAERANTTWAQAGESMAGSFASIGQSFAKESSGMAKVAQIFGAIQATISMFTGAAKALELPFPANLAAMAAVLAKGASLVASIKSQSVPGFKTGGSFRVGGSGGADSQRVSFMATPGEMVDIRRPGQGGMGEGSSRKEIVLRGLKPTDIFTGKQLLELLSEAVGDGGRLKVA